MCAKRSTALNVASLVWHRRSELHRVQAEVVGSLGHTHQAFAFDEPIPGPTDIVLVQGPYGTLLPLVQQIKRQPPRSRPIFVYWFQQSLLLFGPPRVGGLLSKLFSELYRHYNRWDLGAVRPNFLKARGKRLGYLGDILWLDGNALLDQLVLSSTVYFEYLSALGVRSMIVPRGYHPSFGKLLGLERDIAAVWLGKLRTRRRRAAVEWVRKELQKRGEVVHVYDGENEDFIFGDRRTEILNRARFVLNIFFSGPTDELSIRYYVAAANGAVILTEPGLNKYPFVAGKHLVESPVEEMPDKIAYYLEHEDERRAIAGAMLALVQEELALERSISEILKQAAALREEPSD